MRFCLGPASVLCSPGIVSAGIVAVMVSSPLAACALDGLAHMRYNPYGFSIAMSGPVPKMHDTPALAPAPAPMADTREDTEAAQATSGETPLTDSNTEPEPGSGPFP